MRGRNQAPSSKERGNWRERLRAAVGRGANGNKPTAQGIVRSNVWGRSTPLHASYAYSVRTLGCRGKGAVSAVWGRVGYTPRLCAGPPDPLNVDVVLRALHYSRHSRCVRKRTSAEMARPDPKNQTGSPEPSELRILSAE